MFGIDPQTILGALLQNPQIKATIEEVTKAVSDTDARIARIETKLDAVLATLGSSPSASASKAQPHLATSNEQQLMVQIPANAQQLLPQIERAQ